MNRTLARIILFGLFLRTVHLSAQDSVTTLAGQTLIRGLTNGPATNAVFNDPAALAADASGNLYIADSQNHVIRKMDANGLVTTLAGQAGIPGNNNGPGSEARFDTPSGIAVASDGSLLVSDTGNHTIRRISPGGAVASIAGTPGQSGFVNALGAAARFNSPLGLAVASNGTLYVADCGNHSIRIVAPDGSVSTLAGSSGDWGTADGLGANPHFNGPVGLALDDKGDLFVSDSNNQTIRKITPAGLVSTWAGVPLADGHVDGDRLTARFSKPAELALDRHGNLFVADSFNHVIRKISAAGMVETITGLAGSQGDASGVNGQARLFNPYGLAIRPDGSLVISDSYNELIRLVGVPVTIGIQASPAPILFWDSVIGQTYRVQYRDALGIGSWIDLGAPIRATNLTTFVDDTGHPPCRESIALYGTTNPPSGRRFRYPKRLGGA